MDTKFFTDLSIFLGSFAAIGGGIFVWLKALFKKRKEEVEALFSGKTILMQHNFAHFYGLESIGFIQNRGNGVLVLTPDELYFLKAMPRRELKIPLKSITGLSNPRSHLGKSNMSKLLRVEFRNAQGAPDAVAWMVGGDVDAWTSAVNKVRSEES